jgi:hypothetical protein
MQITLSAFEARFSPVVAMAVWLAHCAVPIRSTNGTGGIRCRRNDLQMFVTGQFSLLHEVGGSILTSTDGSARKLQTLIQCKPMPLHTATVFMWPSVPGEPSDVQQRNDMA